MLAYVNNNGYIMTTHQVLTALDDIENILTSFRATEQTLSRTPRGTQQYRTLQQNLFTIHDRIRSRVRNMLRLKDRSWFQSNLFLNTLFTRLTINAPLVEDIIAEELTRQRRTEVRMLPRLHRDMTEDIGRNIASYL